MDHAGITERFIETHFPAAATAVIAGSTARGERTASSDIDLLLIGEDLFDDGSDSAAATYAFEGEIFEVFAYTAAGFDEWAQRGIRQHRPVIVHMLVEGMPLRTGDDYAQLRARWAAALAEGPEVDPRELEFRRYVITDVLDDLRDAVDPLERQVLAGTLFEKTAELMLLSDRRWIGTGKYLPRRLRALDRDRVDALSSPLLRGDLALLADAVEHELARAGGRVQAGFTR
jgi:hypothetical protein